MFSFTWFASFFLIYTYHFWDFNVKTSCPEILKGFLLEIFTCCQLTVHNVIPEIRPCTAITHRPLKVPTLEERVFIPCTSNFCFDTELFLIVNLMISVYDHFANTPFILRNLGSECSYLNLLRLWNEFWCLIDIYYPSRYR